jgi:hypothetical protein
VTLAIWLALLMGIPWLALTPFAVGNVIEETPWRVYTLGGALLVVAMVARRDRWLMAGAGWLILTTVWQPTGHATASAVWLALGVTGLMAVRTAGPRARRGLRAAVVAGACLQALVVLWQTWAGRALIPGEFPAGGTIGNPGLAGGLLALAVPWAPVVWWPVLGAGLGAAGSTTAAAAALLGAAWRAPWWPARGIAAAGGGVLALAKVGGEGWGTRPAVWALALGDWLSHPGAVVLGWGLGGWAARVPALQGQRTWPLGTTAVEFYLQAHNELLQLAYEGGLVAVVLLAAWGLAHRAAWGAGARRDQAALLAVAVLSLAWFPFHVPTLAVVAVTIVGVALPLGPDAGGRTEREGAVPLSEWAEISARIRGLAP